jgi:hypothetical protein
MIFRSAVLLWWWPAHWFKNGSQLGNGGSVSGAMSSTLTLTNITASDDNTVYYVVVANGCGTQTSTNATLAFSTPRDGIKDKCFP